VLDEIVIWRRLDQPGHEAARLVFHDPFWQLSGTAVFAERQQASRLEYLVVCDPAWRTRHGRVAGWVGSRRVRVELTAGTGGRWYLNGTECPQVAGCVDLDLAFSPATNALAIRRLALEPGQAAEVRAAWLTFPDFNLEPLVQLYRRTGPTTYRYEAFGGSFVTDLAVNAAGLVIRYPDLWEAETT
jgi:uncharacterized protein